MNDHIVADTIEARCIRLVGSNGKPRVSMTTTEATATSPELTVIALLDNRGNTRLELQVCGDETGIRLSDNAGKVAISIASRHDGTGVALYDSNEEIGILAGVASDSSRDPDGNVALPRFEITDRTTGQTWYAQDLLRR